MVLGAIRPIVGEIRGQKIILEKNKRKCVLAIAQSFGSGSGRPQGALFPSYFPYLGALGAQGPPLWGRPYTPSWASAGQVTLIRNTIVQPWPVKVPPQLRGSDLGCVHGREVRSSGSRLSRETTRRHPPPRVCLWHIATVVQ